MLFGFFSSAWHNSNLLTSFGITVNWTGAEMWFLKSTKAVYVSARFSVIFISTSTVSSLKLIDFGFTTLLFIFKTKLSLEYSSGYIFNFWLQILLIEYNNTISSPAFIEELLFSAKLALSFVEISDILKSDITIFFC